MMKGTDNTQQAAGLVGQKEPSVYERLRKSELDIVNRRMKWLAEPMLIGPEASSVWRQRVRFAKEVLLETEQVLASPIVIPNGGEWAMVRGKAYEVSAEAYQALALCSRRTASGEEALWRYMRGEGGEVAPVAQAQPGHALPRLCPLPIHGGAVTTVAGVPAGTRQLIHP